MSNHTAENGGIDPQSIHINGKASIPVLGEPVSPVHNDADQGIVTSNGDVYPELVGDYEIYFPTQSGNLDEISGQSSIIIPMADNRGEMSIPTTQEIIQDPEIETIDRLQHDFAEIGETGISVDMNKVHGVYLESIYAPQSILVLDSLLKATAENSKAQSEIRTAIQALDSSVQDIRTLSARKGQSMYKSFLDIDYFSGVTRHEFKQTKDNLKEAQAKAMDCIANYRNSITDPQALQEASEVHSSYIERQTGIELPKGFIERIMDPNTKVLMLELDFNSTLNVKETHAIPGLVNDTQHTIRLAVDAFKASFPEKKIVINLNTGRPDQYIWGAHEAMTASIPEARQFALAESGGVILTNMESGATEVAVENPKQWKAELQGIRDFITGQLANPEDLMIERKQSMLSIRVAEPGSSDFILKTKDGQPVDNEWIKEQMKTYFLDAQNSLGQEELKIKEDLMQRYPDAKSFIETNLNGSSDRNKRAEILKTLEEVYKIAVAEHIRRFDEIDARLDMINMMDREGLLQSKYNPTAGYVDIAHAHLNKYSSSVAYMCKLDGIKPDQIAWAIIGDSSTDIIPDELTAEGEPNEGADKAYMFAVKDHNAKMEAALERRGETGVRLRNESALAVISVMKGIEQAFKQPEPEKETTQEPVVTQ